MHFSTVVLAAFASVGIVSANPTPVEARKSQPTFNPNKYCPQKGPFALKTVSSTAAYNNQYLVGYHIGAAIDLAALSSKRSGRPFYLNATSYSYNGPDKNGKFSDIQCSYNTLAYQVAPNIPFQGGLNVNLTSNIAQLWLSVIDDLPGTGSFSFNKKNQLTLNGDQRWYGCNQTFEGYGPYPSIGWEFGRGAPTDKTCHSLTIVKA